MRDLIRAQSAEKRDASRVLRTVAGSNGTLYWVLEWEAAAYTDHHEQFLTAWSDRFNARAAQGVLGLQAAYRDAAENGVPTGHAHAALVQVRQTPGGSVLHYWLMGSPFIWIHYGQSWQKVEDTRYRPRWQQRDALIKKISEKGLQNRAVRSEISQLRKRHGSPPVGEAGLWTLDGTDASWDRWRSGSLHFQEPGFSVLIATQAMENIFRWGMEVSPAKLMEHWRRLVSIQGWLGKMATLEEEDQTGKRAPRLEQKEPLALWHIVSTG